MCIVGPRLRFLEWVLLGIYCMSSWCKAYAISVRLCTVITGSNIARGKAVYSCFYVFYCLVYIRTQRRAILESMEVYRISKEVRRLEF